jgi:hypothetical protein
MVTALLVFVCASIMGCVDCTLNAGETRVTGSGRVVEVERSIPRVTGVHLATFGDLKIKIGKKHELMIEAEDNLVEFIETDVEDGVLRIGTRKRVNLRPKKKVRYFLIVTELEDVWISSSGDIYAPHIETDEFGIKISSSGDLVLKGVDATQVSVRLSSSGDADLGRIDARELDVGISSSGDLTIEDGKVRFQSIRISSSGDYNGADVRSDNAHVSISSSGDAYLHVDGELNVTLSSSGSVFYSGDATTTIRSSSSGRVKHVGH